MPKDKWKEVDPQSILEYILPNGVTENCKLEEDTYIFIGTNKGIYLTSVYRLNTKQKSTPKSVGLTGFSITELKRDRDDPTVIYAKTDSGKVFKSLTFQLTGMR